MAPMPLVTLTRRVYEVGIITAAGCRYVYRVRASTPGRATVGAVRLHCSVYPGAHCQPHLMAVCRLADRACWRFGHWVVEVRGH